MITFYVDKNKTIGLPSIPLLYPFWGIETNKNTPYPNRVFEKYGFNPTYYRLSSRIEECDYILVPHNYWHIRKKKADYIDYFVELSKRSKKPILIDARGDIDKKVSVPGSVILKIAQFRFNKNPNEIIVPMYVDDLLEHYRGGEMSLRKKSAIPTVGFAGWARLSPKLRLRTRLKELPIMLGGFFNPALRATQKGVLFRERAVRHLSQSPNILTNFLARPTYSGHLETVTGDAELVRREFVDNILSSDYALDVRGDANASCRFYEILSLGRVPLFIDTERVMPLEDKINYKEFCLWVDWKDLSQVGNRVTSFHNSISPERFVEMQKKAREVFDTKLRIDRFTPYLMEELKKRAQTFRL